MHYQVPKHSDEIKVSFPADHVMLLTFNRPKSLNAMTPTMDEDIDRVLSWFENEPSLWYVPMLFHGRRAWSIDFTLQGDHRHRRRTRLLCRRRSHRVSTYLRILPQLAQSCADGTDGRTLRRRPRVK